MPTPPPTITDVITAAAKPGHAHLKATLGPVPDWLALQATKHGLAITGFHHSIDTSAVRHIHSRHGNPTSEIRRGNLAITSTDFENIPDLLGNPDKLIFGAKNKRMQPLIAYLKNFPDGTVLYLEEVRAGRKDLATLTMRKYSTTIDAGRLAANFDLYGRTDSGAITHIVEHPQNVTLTPAPAPPSRRARLLHYLPPTLGVLVLAGIIYGLHGALARIGPRDVLAALSATPLPSIAHAFALLAVSFGIMTIYDLPGILFAKKLVSFPRIFMRHVALASFSAYALSHVLGAPALTGAAIRLRLYAQWQVPAAGIARIIALSGTAFILGAACIASLILMLAPATVPLFGRAITVPTLQIAGVLLLACIAAYIVLAGRSTKPLILFGRQLPGSRLTIAQLFISGADITIAGAILFCILPAAPGLSLPNVLAVYLAAFAGGLLSAVPAGAGVFDTLLLLGLAAYLPPAAAIGAILLFRIIYYVIPASAAALCFAAHEIFLTAKG